MAAPGISSVMCLSLRRLFAAEAGRIHFNRTASVDEISEEFHDSLRSFHSTIDHIMNLQMRIRESTYFLVGSAEQGPHITDAYAKPARPTP